METKKIYGYRKFTSKKGSATCIVQCGSPYSNRDIEHGACGTKIEEVWIPEEFQGLISPACIGKNLEIGYSIVNGRAYINSVAVK